MVIPPITLKTIYHGSDKIVERPLYGAGKSDNDYGSGFYTTEDCEKSKQWAVLFGSEISVCNKYIIETRGLTILNLDDYGPLAWIAELVYNRGAVSDEARVAAEAFCKKYRVDSSQADIIIGSRATGNYLEATDAFLEGKLSVDETFRLLKKGGFGLQFFIKSERAFNAITFKSHEYVKDDEFVDCDAMVKIEITKFLNNRTTQIEQDGYVVQGLNINDVLSKKYEYDTEYDYLKEVPEYTAEELRELEALEREIAELEKQKKVEKPKANEEYPNPINNDKETGEDEYEYETSL